MATHRNTVLDALVTALKNIDGTGSYYHDLQGQVFRLPENVAASGQPKPCLIVHEGEELYDYEASPTPGLDRALTVSIRGFVDGPSGDLPRLADELLADCERAILSDQTLGGVARETIVRSNTPEVGAENDAAGLTLILEIRYRTYDADPDTKLA